MSRGRTLVYLVGAGPGDPGLLTRRGADVLASADVVIYDHLASARLLELAPSGALRICAGKSSGHCLLDQDQINRLLVEHARQGRIVVRLKGGDPFVFGRGAEEAEALRNAWIPFEIVPGVTAGVGVTAYAGIPVTHRGETSAVAFVTGHDDPESEPPLGLARSRLDWKSLARFPGTLVVYMGVTHLAAICRVLVRHGMDPEMPAAVVHSGTVSAQRVVEGQLGTIAARASESRISPPALLVVGTVVSRRRTLEWFESRPLFGKRFVITRPAEEADQSASVLESLGAEVLIAPTVEIRPIRDPGPMDDAIEKLERYDWLVFTSGNGVRHFLERLISRGKDLRALGRIRLAAIGPTTAEALTRYRLTADLIPESYRSESLGQALAVRAAGGRILLARADRGRVVLKELLEKVAEVHQVPVYENADVDALDPHVLARITEGSVDWITLTSSAIAKRLHDLLPAEARAQVGRTIRLASLSPVTSGSISALGWEVAVEAAVYTWEGLIQAILERVKVEEHPLKSSEASSLE